MDKTMWVNLVNPSADELKQSLPDNLFPTALRQLQVQSTHDDEPRPRIEGHDFYIFAVLVLPITSDGDHDVLHQEIDVILTREHIYTVSKSPAGSKPYNLDSLRENALKEGITPGMCAYRLLDELAEKYLDLIDSFDDDVDLLEDQVETWDPEMVRNRISELRHDLLHVRRMLTPTRDVARAIVDERIDVNGRKTVFPREVLLHFADAYDKFLRATDGLDLSRDLLAGVRDYHQAQVANNQNEVMKRLTVIASMLLVPTFIVGLYGQNLKNIPEFHWSFGYEWSWFLILVTTAVQFWYFKKKKWI